MDSARRQKPRCAHAPWWLLVLTPGVALLVRPAVPPVGEVAAGAGCTAACMQEGGGREGGVGG
jgi:hypothetical protein